ncbi:hypothetical protein ONS96_003271 [Cadophora gregata f. sp. sojae]|nr:hypothetical protein ONS96_003271 [Cadophora gregata f. sp. sojae]
MARLVPLEILVLIASYAVTPELLNLSLTCRELRDIAIPYIWEHLIVEQEDGVITWSPGGTSLPTTHLHHVKQFDMVCMNTDFMSSAERTEFGQTLKLCFERMTNVEKLKYDSFRQRFPISIQY